MLEKIKVFWNALIYALKKTVEKPLESNAQSYQEIERINFLAMFVNALSNLSCTECEIKVDSESTQADPLTKLAEKLTDAQYEITETMLASGECFRFPVADRTQNLYGVNLPREFVTIVDYEGDKIYEAYAIINTRKKNNRVYLLIRHHKLENGTLTVSFFVCKESGERTTHEDFADVDGTVIQYVGANHIGFARYTSPRRARKQSIYGMPLNFDCVEIENKIIATLKLIQDEFGATGTKIFADLSLRKKNKQDEDGKPIPKIENGIYWANRRSGETGNLIDIFNPTIRTSAYYEELQNLFALYEKQIGLNKGILTNNDTTAQATATQVKRSNANTIAFITRIHAALDKGNAEFLEACNMVLNVPQDLWIYNSEWYDPFEDPAEQWKRIREAAQDGAIQTYRETQWLYPNMSQEDAQKEVEASRINLAGSADAALESALSR